MKTTIEEINGELYTVVWCGDMLEHNIHNEAYDYIEKDDGSCEYYHADFGDWIATALPALPRNPTVDDAPLLCRYMAEGLMIHGNTDNWPCADMENITHATSNGERVEIAVKE